MKIWLCFVKCGSVRRNAMTFFSFRTPTTSVLHLDQKFSPIINITSGGDAPASFHKSGANYFLNSDNDKNDYEWLLTPPGTPLFPSLEMESQKTVMSQLETPKAHPTSLKSRLTNSMPEPARSNLSSRQLTSSSGLNTSTGGLHRPCSSGGGPGSRPSTPTGRPTISSTSSRSSSTPASNRRAILLGWKD